MNEKAEMNIKAGKWAECNGYYDVAVSRYYYSIYQRMIYISKKNGFYKEPKTNDPHKEFITIFNEEIIRFINPEDIMFIYLVSYLKKLRVKADYKKEKIREVEYQNSFKAYYIRISKILDELIKKVK